MMKKFISKNNLLRFKKLLLTKEVILILAALLITVVFALAHSGGGKKPPERQRSVIPSMSGGMVTQENTPSTEPSEPPPEPGAETPLSPESDIPLESDMEPFPPEIEPELPDTELPPDDIGENTTPVTPPPGMTPPPGAAPSDMPPPGATPPPSASVLPEPELQDTQSEPPPVTTPEVPAETPPETTPELPPELPPSETPDDSIIDIAPPQSPTISFMYIWSGSSFKPCADIIWTAESALRINWQLCGADGSVLLEGEIPASGGAASRLTNFAFDTSAQSQNGLYPKGYTLKFTPLYSTGTDTRELEPHVMELPYFEVTTQIIDGELCPAIATNVGMYFVHSLENLNNTVTGGKLRITGNLLPIEGVQTPLSIDVLSK